MPQAAQVDTRDLIITMAERLFRDVGYQKTTVADIARALKMSPANVYRFFDSKKAINEAVAARLMGEVETIAAALIAKPSTSSSQTLTDLVTLIHRKNSELYISQSKMHEMVAAAMEESWGVIHAHIERLHALLARVLLDGMKRGEFIPSDPIITARCLHMALARFFHPQLIAQCADIPGPSLEDMMKFLLKAIRV